jgi:hypothetical protein
MNICLKPLTKFDRYFCVFCGGVFFGFKKYLIRLGYYGLDFYTLTLLEYSINLKFFKKSFHKQYEILCSLITLFSLVLTIEKIIKTVISRCRKNLKEFSRSSRRLGLRFSVLKPRFRMNLRNSPIPCFSVMRVNPAFVTVSCSLAIYSLQKGGGGLSVTLRIVRLKNDTSLIRQLIQEEPLPPVALSLSFLAFFLSGDKLQAL